jgi:hypothetical protein
MRSRWSRRHQSYAVGTFSSVAFASQLGNAYLDVTYIGHVALKLSPEDRSVGTVIGLMSFALGSVMTMMMCAVR